MNLSGTVSKIDNDLIEKIFQPTPCILHPHWRGSPWNWVPALGIKS